jgi:hypothetical protein
MYEKFLNLLPTIHVHKVHFTFVCKVEKLKFKKKRIEDGKNTTFLVDR